MSDIKIKVISMDYHRNGVGGNPFYVVLFTSKDGDKGTMLGIVFPEKDSVAVLGVDKLTNGDIKFASNSWRGDRFEPALRLAIEKEDKDFSL
jgi:hypothetical protein